MRWLTYSSYLDEKYGKKLYRVGVDGGFSCPNRDKDGSKGCIFCDGSGAVAVYQRTFEKGYELKKELLKARISGIEEQVKRGLSFIKRRYKADEAALYFQSYSNTYDSVENLKKVYDYALSLYDFRQLIVSTRPDLLSNEVCALLKSYETENRDVWVELGLQSANDDTLKKINRGHDVECFISAVKRAKTHGLHVTAHVLLMPSYDDLSSIDKLIKIINDTNCDGIKIHNIHITHNTELERRYLEEGCFASISYKRHIMLLSYIISRLKSNIIIERLMTETPRARLVYPIIYPDKRDLIEDLEVYMEENNLFQGCLLPSLENGV